MMTTSSWGYVRSMLGRDLRVSRTYPLLLLAQSLGILVTVVTTWFVAKLVDPGTLASGDYFSFVVTALVVTAFLGAALPSLARNVREEQQRGTLEAIVALGVGPVAYSLGAAAGPLAYVTPQIVVLGVAGGALGLELEDANWSLAIVALVVGTVSFVGVGLVGAAAVLAFRRAEALVGWLLVALAFLAGEFFPRSLLPGWLEWLGVLSPVTWCLQLVRGALLDGMSWEDAWGELGALGALAVVTCSLGGAALVAALRHARRRGTLALY
jgi:ABC-2 type transport system permease protein